MASGFDAVAVIGADIEDFENKVGRLEDKIKQIDKAVDNSVKLNVRKLANVARLTLYTIQAITGVLDQVLFSMIEASLLAYEAIVAIATAESLTLVGAFKAGLQFATAIAILVQARNLAKGRADLAARSSGSVQALRTFTMFF